MNKNSIWFISGIGIIGFAIGILFIGSVSTVSHWAGTPKFFGEFCHSMNLVNKAYKKGLHYQTASGVTVGCTDCHLLNKFNEHNGPVDYTLMMIDKAKAGTNSLVGEIQGTLSTPEKQMVMRQILSSEVHEQMKERSYSTCRGCHDLSRMNNIQKPYVAELHRNLEQGVNKPVDCLACHPTAGHNYAALLQKQP